MADLGKIAESLIAGKIDEVKSQTQEAVDAGEKPEQIMQQGLLAGMGVVGERFRDGDMFIPEVLRCAKAMHASMDVLRPLLSQAEVESGGLGAVNEEVVKT